MLDKKYGYWALSALSKTSEPIRANRWLASFNFGELTGASSFPSSEMLSFHVKDVDMPEFTNETDSMYYFGVERKLVTSSDNSGSITMTILEGENLIGYNSLLRWLQQCSNVGQFSIDNVSIEGNSRNNKFPFNAPSYDNGETVNSNVLKLEMFSYVSGKTLFDVSFRNIKPIKVGGTKLAYEGNELYKYTVTFDYDLATIHRNIVSTGTMNKASDVSL